MKEAIGFVLSVSGAQATARLRADGLAPDREATRIAIGRLAGIRTPTSLAIGIVSRLRGSDLQAEQFRHSDYSAEIDLLGEVSRFGSPEAVFRRGVTEYPSVGDEVFGLTAEDLGLVHRIDGHETITVGQLSMDASVPAYINFDELLRKHFAVLGTTGVGKSSSVALILRAILQKKADLRILLLDPHNEYGRCFGDLAQVISPRNLRLPFWLFNFEEIVDVVFGARPGIEEETEILTELIPLSKARYAALRRGESAGKSTGFTPDTPVPYLMSDLLNLIDGRMGRLSNHASSPRYQRLMTRIEALTKDPRYAFMFDVHPTDDMMVQVISELFRLPTAGKPITVLQLAGFPAEVIDSVVSVVCRLAFEFGVWSDGTAPVLVACEEAHRYAPADRKLGFGPTRKALSRIAKEGRKYSVFLGVITPRAADLDTTILSQCSTVFAMRMSNDRDKKIVRSAVPDAGSGLIKVLASLGVREAIAFGEGVALPTRIRFAELAPEFLPVNQSGTLGRLENSARKDREFVAMVVDRWRGFSATEAGQRSDSDAAKSRASIVSDFTDSILAD